MRGAVAVKGSPVGCKEQLLAGVPIPEQAGSINHEHRLLMRLLIQRLRSHCGQAALTHSRPHHIVVHGLYKGIQVLV